MKWLALLAVTALLAPAAARAQDVVFLSTQLRPIEEAQKVRDVLLKGAPKATNVTEEPPPLTVRLQAGFALGEVKSQHHPVKTEKVNDGSQIIRLAEGVVAADREFDLTWTPAAEKAPSVGLFREHVGDADYLLAYVTPPTVDNAAQ